MKLLKYILATCIVLLLFTELSEAQCSMCRASVESSSTMDGGKGQGFNAGILYLMAIPYIIFCCIAFFWYRNTQIEAGKEFSIMNILFKRKKAGI